MAADVALRYPGAFRWDSPQASIGRERHEITSSRCYRNLARCWKIKPHDDPTCIHVDLAHEVHLAVALVKVALIDADGIYS